jgi:hypothetical protein
MFGRRVVRHELAGGDEVYRVQDVVAGHLTESISAEILFI